MTRNYLQYMSNVETNRSNLAHEQENKRHNLAYEAEVNRHNVATETETNRHNLVMEENGWAVLAEQSRHNYATELATQISLAETGRHNLVVEAISGTQANASQLSAVASQIQAMAAQTNADTNWYNAQTNRLSQQTQQQKLELDKNVHNENQRHNFATELIARDRFDLDVTMSGPEMFKDVGVAANQYTGAARNVLQFIQAFR